GPSSAPRGGGAGKMQRLYHAGRGRRQGNPGRGSGPPGRATGTFVRVGAARPPWSRRDHAPPAPPPPPPLDPLYPQWLATPRPRRRRWHAGCICSLSPEDEPDPEGLAVSAPTILLVDDDDVLGQVLHRVLSRQGCTVVRAADVAQALRLAR